MKILINIVLVISAILFLLLAVIYAQYGLSIVGKILIGFINLTKYSGSYFPSYLDTPESGSLLNIFKAMQLGASFLAFNLQKEAGTTESYDFVIIGAGPTGSVIANRLSEISKWKVLLLEAGGETSFLNNIPAACMVLRSSDYDWGYRSEVQDGYCRGCLTNNVNLAHGKCLGGSTSINFMIMVRGNPADYDDWAQQGNPGWSYYDVLPYYKKMEDAYIERQDEEYHGKGGYLTVSDIPYKTKIANILVEAYEQAGYPYVDYNGKRQIGVSYCQGTIRNGSRCSAETAYLRPVRDKSNIKIYTGATVTNILINPKTKEASGVRYYKNGQYYEVLAEKEVILSAGSLNSPQLLMLSGIGPKEHLEDLGIPVVRNLPVGQKMYDHAVYPGLIVTINKQVGLDLTDFLSLRNINDYRQHGTGPLSSTGGIEVLSFVKLKSSQEKNSSKPDVEMLNTGSSMTLDKGILTRDILNIPLETYNNLIKPLENVHNFQVLPMLLHPRSSGHIELRSKNPFDPPKFFSNFLSDPENYDLKIFIESIRELQRIIEQPVLQKYRAKLAKIIFPGCEDEMYDSDPFWVCQLKTIVSSVYHQTATCKMGPKKDPEAVVDPELRVHGIKKLRVADASIIPVTLSAHTMGPTYMIGEKASDLIKQAWKAE